MRTRFLSSRQSSPPRRLSFRPQVEGLEQRCLLDAGLSFLQTGLASSVPGLTAHTDKDLINPWGFSETPDGQFRISANGAGEAPLLNADGTTAGKDVIIPLPGNAAGTSAPNGNLTNATKDFVIHDGPRSAPATVLFSTEDGTIAGWNPAVNRTHAFLGADQSGNGAVYKLLGAGTANGANYLYATNFHNGTVDVFDKNFHLHTFFAGQFTDPHPVAGFAPFGVKNINNTLYVTYAKQDAVKHDDVEGAGNGFIDKFDTSGHFLGRFASGTAAGGTLTHLNSLIGMTIAPAGFGNFGGDLLVGNFGDSTISAFDPNTGAFRGQLQDAHGHALVLNGGFTGTTNPKGLWGIGFGNGADGASTHTLFFAAGINEEKAGLFGKVTVADRDHDRDEDHRDDLSATPPAGSPAGGRHDDDVARAGGERDRDAAQNQSALARLEDRLEALAGGDAKPGAARDTAAQRAIDRLSGETGQDPFG